jgi:hypothetical protein
MNFMEKSGLDEVFVAKNNGASNNGYFLITRYIILIIWRDHADF